MLENIRPRDLSHLGVACVSRRRRVVRLELLEDRVAPARLDLVAGELSYTATAGVANQVTLSLTAGIYTVQETGGETIALGPGLLGWRLSSDARTASGPTAGITAITLILGDAADRVSIRSLAVPTHVEPGDGMDELVIGSLAPSRAGNLDGIAAALTVDNTGAEPDLLLLVDSTASGVGQNSNVQINASSITGLAGPGGTSPILFSGRYQAIRILGSNFAIPESYIVNGPLAPLQLDMGQGNDTARVNAIAPNNPATILGGGGNDLFRVGADVGTLNGLAAGVTLDGGAGGNTLLIRDAGEETTPNTDVKIVNDPVAQVTAVTGLAGVTNDVPVSFQTQTFSAVTIEGSRTLPNTFSNIQTAHPSLTVVGGDGNDSFSLALTGPTIHGGTGTDRLSGPGVRDVLLTSSGATTGFDSSRARFTGIDILSGIGFLTGRNAVSRWTAATTATYSDGVATLTWSGFHTLQGGDQADYFGISVSGLSINGNAGADVFDLLADALGATIDGGSGDDSLRYSGYLETALDAVLNAVDANGFSGRDQLSGSFRGIDSLLGGGNDNDRLTGLDAASSWSATPTVFRYSESDAHTLAFVGFESLRGGSGLDRFTVRNWSETLTLDGGPGKDTLDLTLAGGTVNIATAETLFLGSDLIVTRALRTATVNGNLDLNRGDRTIQVANGLSLIDILITGVIAGTGTLTKTGEGLLQLSGANTYLGPTSVNGGTLRLLGSITSTDVNNTGTLDGTGTILGNLATNQGGTVAPGSDGVGTLTVSGSAGFAQGATFDVELRGTAITMYDRLIVGDTLTLSNANLAVNADTPLLPAIGQAFTVIDANSVRGDWLQGNTVVSSGIQRTYLINNPDGSGDVVLTDTAPVDPLTVLVGSTLLPTERDGLLPTDPLAVTVAPLNVAVARSEAASAPKALFQQAGLDSLGIPIPPAARLGTNYSLEPSPLSYSGVAFSITPASETAFSGSRFATPGDAARSPESELGSRRPIAESAIASLAESALDDGSDVRNFERALAGQEPLVAVIPAREWSASAEVLAPETPSFSRSAPEREHKSWIWLIWPTLLIAAFAARTVCKRASAGLFGYSLTGDRHGSFPHPNP